MVRKKTKKKAMTAMATKVLKSRSGTAIRSAMCSNGGSDRARAVARACFQKAGDVFRSVYGDGHAKTLAAKQRGGDP